MASVPEPRQHRTIFHYRRVEQPVVQLGTRAQSYAVAVLAAVGKGDQQRAERPGLSVELEFVLAGRVAPSFADTDENVRPQATRALRAEVELRGDAGVDPGAGGHESERGGRTNQRRTHFVDGAIAAPYDHDVGAVGHGGARQLAGVPG